MFIVICNSRLVGFVQTPTYEQARLHAEHRVKGDYLIVNPTQRRDLSAYSIAQLGSIIKNTTNKPMPILHGFSEALSLAWDALEKYTPEDETSTEALIKQHGPLPKEAKSPTFDGGRIPVNPETDPDAKAERARRVTEAALHAGEARATRTPRQSTAGAAPTRPREGTTTARVWSIADDVRATLGAADHGQKTERNMIVQKCVDAGIDPSTAATQYSKWKRAQA